jgi:hypothetical protein
LYSTFTLLIIPQAAAAASSASAPTKATDAKAAAEAQSKAGADAVACHIHNPAALFKSWNAGFIAIGSSSFAFGITVEKAITRAQAAQQPFIAGKTFPLHGCSAKAVGELAGRSHVMAVGFPSATAVPKHHFVFEDRCLRDAFIQRLQVRNNNNHHNHEMNVDTHREYLDNNNHRNLNNDIIIIIAIIYVIMIRIVTRSITAITII